MHINASISLNHVIDISSTQRADNNKDGGGKKTLQHAEVMFFCMFPGMLYIDVTLAVLFILQSKANMDFKDTAHL